MITVVLTAGGRPELLKRTLDSFNEFNTYKDVEIIIYDDSLKQGQVKAIDWLYSQVKTKYLFHCEDDWLFYRPGFIEKSLAILQANPEILTVWLRDLNDTNTHPVERDKTYCIYDTDLEHKITEYYLMATGALGGNWNGFTFNPGLRRLSDYELIKPFSQYIMPGDFAALTECRIDNIYHKLGFRSAILPEGYVRHIG